MGMRTGELARGRRPGAAAAGSRVADQPGARRSFRFRGDSHALLTAALTGPAPLPPLPARPRADLAVDAPAMPEAPAWSPLAVALPLFAVIWACFAALAATVDAPPAADVVSLGRVLAAGAAVGALVLVTLSVAHAQISARGPRPAVVAVVTLGLGQGVAAAPVGGQADLWGLAAWVFVLAGVTVPLAWVGGQFQCGVRRQRVERRASLTASWIERARRQAHQTVQSIHRHDVRSMLFVIDGAARTLADDRLTAEQRASFGEVLGEGVQRLGALMDVSPDEIQPFAVDDVARAVVHAERKAGQQITAELPAGLIAVGRAADVAAVLRTVVTVTAGKSPNGVQLRTELGDGVIVVRIAPGGGEDEPLPLLLGNWEAVRADSFKPIRQNDDETVDLYVAARLLAEQGADLWSTAGRAQFAVRLPVVADPIAREGA